MVGPAAGTAEKRAAELLAELVKTRAGVESTIGDKAGAGPTIALAVEPSPPGAVRPADGYRIACDAGAKRWTVTGATPSGLVAGVGRLMRSMRFEADRVAVPTTTVDDAPQMPNRGMYLWARKYYFNQPDQVDRSIEEFALWGGNAICFWFEMGMFEDFADTKGEKSELNSAYARMTAEEREYYDKAKQPLMVFPDISMWGNHPGMLVNKQYWKSLQDELNSYDPELMKGGWPYAERWNTDIASVMFLSWFWNPKQPIETILDDYSAFYFGPEATAVRELLDLLDDGNTDPERKAKIRDLRTALDGRLPAWAKADWRWREIEQSADRFTTR